MQYVGIDLGATKSSVCVLDEDGAVLDQCEVATSELGEYLKRYKGRVVMESCTQSRRVAELAQAAGHRVVVVPGSFVRQLGVGARGIKTDARDAEVLARASLRNPNLPSVRPCCDRSRDHRRLLKARQQLVRTRTRCVASIKTYLRGELIVVRGRALPSTFCQIVKDLLLARPDGIPLDISIQLDHLTDLQKHIDKLNASIDEIVQQDQVCRRLMTVPGVGPVVSLAFASTVDETATFQGHGATRFAGTWGQGTDRNDRRRRCLVSGAESIEISPRPGATSSHLVGAVAGGSVPRGGDGYRRRRDRGCSFALETGAGGGG